MIAYTTIESYPKVRRPISPPPPKTPIKTVQELTKFCTQDQFEEFTETLGECAIISDLSQVMVDAIKLGRTCFVKELIRLGLPLSPGYVYEAVGACAKDILETIFESGWDINQPMGTMYPPILRSVIELLISKFTLTVMLLLATLSTTLR